MITAGLALGVIVALLGGTVALVGAGLGQVPQGRLEAGAAVARLSGRRLVLAGLILFVVTWVVWLVMIAVANIFAL